MRNDKTNSEFISALKTAAERDTLRLHTPGHKGKLSPLDITELTDDSFPYPALIKAERHAAEVYGARHARYLCGGSSQGVKSAVFYAETNAVVDVNSHRAVFDGFKLSGKKYTAAGERGSIKPLTVKQIEKSLEYDTGAVVVTSPTYYGYCADIVGIHEFCKSRGLLLIVDGAHGAHFGFSPRLPKAFAAHCDVCNVSAHKTLSALTQTALLFDNLSGAESEKLFAATDIMGTTSPSYLLYASIEHAVERAEESAAAYESLYDPVCELKRKFPFADNDDFTRLVLDCTRLCVSPQKLNAALVARGVYSEKTDAERIVFILTAEDTAKEVAALDKALTEGIREL